MPTENTFVQTFLDFANIAQLPFFTPKADYPLIGLDYLPRNPNIHKADFALLGFLEQAFYDKNYRNVQAAYYIWKINPNESIDNQPIVLAIQYNFTPIGVVARNLREFLSMLAFPQSMRFGLNRAYEHLWKIEQGKPSTAPTGKLDFELSQFQTQDSKYGKNATELFLTFLEQHQIQLCEDIYKTILDAMCGFKLLDSASPLHQLSKNFPDLQMPDLIAYFYLFVSENRINLPEFEDDCGTHISQSGIVPHFVRADLAPYFIKLGLTGSGGYYAIWRIFPDKKIEDNPIVYLDSEASPVAVVACNFQEYLCIAWVNIHSMIYQIESAASSGSLDGLETPDLDAELEEFKEANQADEYENLPERASLYFDFINQLTPMVADKNPFQIIKNAYLNMPNLLEWLKKEMPEHWDY